jgi:hypothetical protein
MSDGTWEMNNGGQAFPPLSIPGMTLRDWFAGQAIANERVTGDPDVITKEAYLLSVAEDAFIMADAMIEARKGGVSA